MAHPSNAQMSLARRNVHVRRPASVIVCTTQGERRRRAKGGKAYETTAGCAMMAGVKRGQDEAEFYREIVVRAKRVRERAAESLRLSRRLRQKHGDVGSPPDSAPRSRRKRT